MNVPTTPLLLCDNQSAIFLAANPVSHNRSKHIELDYHFVRELVSSKQLWLQYVPTTQQVADVFTKSLGRPAFTLLLFKLRVRDFQLLGLWGVLELMTEDLQNLLMKQQLIKDLLMMERWTRIFTHLIRDPLMMEGWTRILTLLDSRI